MKKKKKVPVTNPAVQKAYKKHSRIFEKWREGEPKEAWYDEAGNLCIRYKSGMWWHYSNIDHAMTYW